MWPCRRRANEPTCNKGRSKQLGCGPRLQAWRRLSYSITFAIVHSRTSCPGSAALQGETGNFQRRFFPGELDGLLALAEQIITKHTWPIMGLGDKSFGDPIDWLRDPVSDANWPLDYHADMNLNRGDGSDVRVLWELNRLPHLITLARAYAVTGDERFTTEYLQQLASWRSQNPYGYGPNWNCAMEVALRAINLLGAFRDISSFAAFR